MRCPPKGKAAAAPATVIGKCSVKMPLGNREGGRAHGAESQETGRPHLFAHMTPEGWSRRTLVNAQSYSAPISAVGQRSEALKAGALALLLGTTLVFTAGFSHSATIHNAGHDTRHALSFPCH